MYSLYSGLIINISLLVLIATLLTKITFVKRVMAEEHAYRTMDQLILVLIFGGFCIFSTCTGVRINGAIQNTRVLGALAAGLLGGPMVGMGAAVIGAVHRFLYDPMGFTSVACAMSTLFEGIIGSLVWLIFKHRERKQTTLSLFLITAFAECSQMCFILAIARPFSDALALVKVIAVPMTLINSLGMVLFFSVFNEVFTSQDLLAANKIRLALTIADECIPYIQKTARTREDYNAMAKIIKKYANCNGVLFLERDGKTALNDTKLVIPPELFSWICGQDRGVAFCRVADKTDANYRYLKRYSAFGAPLTQGKVIWAYLVIFLPRQVLSTQAEMDFLEGFAKFFSTNYELAQVEKQKKLRQRAEYQALQSQINPHFLFNSLNTISFFCREKPERARELLLALSVYFRNTLEATDAYMIPLEKELAHVKAYLELEEARFEERLTVEIDVEPDNRTDGEKKEVLVPTLILQPIVENAVKHGAMKQEHGIVTITGRWEKQGYSVIVTDNGPGLSPQALENFKQRKKEGKYGLQNVDSRMRSIYGENSGLSIDTGADGTRVTMHFFKEQAEKTHSDKKLRIRKENKR